jgi:hypothetical protein
MDPASLWQSEADQEWVGIIESSGANPLVEAVCYWKMMPACHLSLCPHLKTRVIHIPGGKIAGTKSKALDVKGFALYKRWYR